jgi:hypothetical protein
MADLTAQEKRAFERVFGMGSGYVLNFSNRTFGNSSSTPPAATSITKKGLLGIVWANS